MGTTKRKITWLSVVAVLLLCLVVVSVWLIHEHQLDAYRDDVLSDLEARRGEYDEQSIVLYNTSKGQAQELAERFSASLRITEDGRFATLTLPEGTTIEDVFQDKSNREVLEKLSPDYSVTITDYDGKFDRDDWDERNHRHPERPSYTVSDGEYNSQTYLDYLNLQNVWSKTTGRGITVAVLDTGIDTDHPEFAGRISAYSYNASEDKIVKDYLLEDGTYDWSLIEDEQGHGTSVAGVLGASMNQSGIVGIAPNVTLLVIKAECDENGTFKRTSDLVFGLYYAIERDVNVVNMSFGTYAPSNPFAAATKLAVDSDIICVAAAGNDATTALTWPAADENVIGVGSLEQDGWNLAEYSNYGENIDIVAPGTVYTTLMGDSYGYANGTSMASPITAGVIALSLYQNHYTTFDAVQELLYASSYDLGSLGEDWVYGYGALDASAMILEERGTVTFNMLTDELDNTTQTFIRNHTLQNMPEPERLYAVFDGWYYDAQCTEKYNWYADTFTADLTLYAHWVNEEDGIPYTYVELDDGTIEIRSYTGRRRYITIPDYIDGKVVSSIGDSAFSGETALREVNLPRYLVNISRDAFRDCANLTEIVIPDTVKTIGEGAFYGNIRLSGVSFGDNASIITIGNYAFAGCSSLERFEIPASLTSVNGSAFYGTFSLTAVSVRKGSHSFASKDGVLFNKTASELVAYPAGLAGTYTVPNSVRTIGNYAFAYSKLTTVELNKVQSIGRSAFTYSMLTSVTIPDSVTAMEDSAFYGASHLKEVVLGTGLSEISDGAFAHTALISVEIPANIREIGASAFSVNSLATVTFEENSRLAFIGDSAFSGTSLKEIAIPASVITIGPYAFASDYLLATVTFEEGSVLRTIGDSAFASAASLESVIFPESLETIGSFAFASAGLSGTVTLPDGLTTLGAGAFASCHALEAIAVGEGNAKYASNDGVVYTKDGTSVVAYPADKKNTSYSIKQGTQSVANAAFYGAWKLKSVSLPEGLTVVGEYAFYDCRNIQQYALSSTLEEIKQYAFAQNLSITSMTMPDSVIQISNYAFSGDTKLSSVIYTENSKLPRISYGAFAYSGLTSFRVPANVSTMAQGAFLGCANLTSFTFAAGSKLESISAYMFDGCANLTAVTFEEGSALTSIQAHGFEGATKLTTVDFGGAKLKNIDNFAFRFCESLSSLSIPEGVTNIGRFAFYGCASLAELSLPTTLEHIGAYAFHGEETMNVYFQSDFLPLYLDENWDSGLMGYYLGVQEIVTDGDWQYAKLNSGKISIIKYNGASAEVDLSSLDLGADIIGIGGRAFYLSPVTKVILPDTLENIQSGAFLSTDITEIVIPASVTFIGREAFAVTELASVTFEEGSKLRVIEQYAFAHNEKLAGITLPASLETMGSYAFADSGITYVTFEEGIGLSEIPENAFAETKLTSVVIPDSVSLVNHNAFRDNPYLKEVVIGKGEGLHLGSNVFYNTALESVHIPANVGYIGEYAFVGLENLTAFTVDAGNPYYAAVDGLLLSKNQKKLIAVPAGRTGSLTLPVSVEVIGFGAFENTALSEIIFSADANILSFGYRAFYGAKNLTKITIPASVVSIDYYAFAECKKLEKVTFAEGSRLTGVYEGAFYGCRNLSDITLPEGIVEISDFAFYGCAKLTKLPIADDAELKGIYSYAMAYTGLTGELVIPESVIDIGAYAFKGVKVTEVTIPEANAKQLIIGIGAFEECDSLEEITLPFIGASYEDDKITWLGYLFGAGAYSANSTYVPESLKHVTIYEGITFLGKGAFCQLTNLETIDVPHSVELLYAYAFKDTSARYELTNGISLDKNGAYYSYFLGNGISGDLIIEEGGSNTINLSDCVYLTSVVLPEGITGISGEAFAGCTALTTVVIPDTVRSIGIRAFLGCTSLSNVVLPKSLTDIRSNAFQGCDSLNKIVIPDSVTSIDYGAFNGCRSLTSVTIPDSVTSIGDFAFMYCSSLTSVTIPDSVTSIGGSAFNGCRSLTSVTIPDSVTSIGGSAFMYCSSLTSVTIPDSVTSIGSYAFRDCTKLQSVYLSKKLTSIESYVFQYCTNLVSIVIPEGVETIGSYSFGNCTNLENITLPTSLTAINGNAFSSNTRLYAVYNNSDLDITIGGSTHGGIAKYAKLLVDKDGNETYGNDTTELVYINTEDGFRFVLENGVYKLIAYLGDKDVVTLPLSYNGNAYELYYMTGVENVIIPEGVTAISDNAFANNKNLKSVVIPAGVTSIGNGAFYGCTSLTSITIPDSVTSIGGSAFYNCTSLESITIPDSVTSIGNSAFSGCKSLISVSLPESLTQISYAAFEQCNNLSSLVIPKNVSEIGSGAFAGCPLQSLAVDQDNAYFCVVDGVIYNKAITVLKYVPEGVTEIVIPKTVTIIDRAFKNNVSIQKVSFEEGTSIPGISNEAFYGCTSLTSITIPDSVINISDSAFYGCTALEAIDLPKGVKSIWDRAFYNCTNLKSITIPDGVTWIDDYLFYGCRSLESITIPEGVTNIGYYAFQNCSSLTSITIPKSVTSIGVSSFEGCANLDSIMMPDSMTSIGGRAFFQCSNLREIVIPNGVKSIEYQTFYHCINLTKITIPDSVTSISDQAFFLLNNLESIEVSSDNTAYRVYDGVLYDISLTKLIKVPVKIRGEVVIPKGIVDIPSGAFQDCKYLTSISIPDSVTSIGSGAFRGCTSLTSITLPDGVTSIGSYAFTNCTGLTSVKLPGGVTSIGSYAFTNCTGLTSVKLPGGLTSIGGYAFYNCTGLTSVKLPDGVTSIGEYAFYNCTGLTSITLPDGMTSIGGSVFEKCSGLVSVTFPDGITSIGAGAFKDCSSLMRITIPGSVTSVESDAFDVCNSLFVVLNNSDLVLTPGGSDYGKTAYYAKVVIDKDQNGFFQGRSAKGKIYTTDEGFVFTDAKFETTSKAYTLVAYLGDEETVTLPSAFNESAYSIYSLVGVKNVVIPNDMTSIDNYAFSGCRSLTGITLHMNVTSIGNGAFYGCTSLTSITIPDSVTSIGGSAFYNCTSLESITIPDSVTSIGDYVFRNCTDLTSITIPDSVTSIGIYAFQNCSSLTSVTIPDSVTSIINYAFEDCSSLTSITIPDSVTSIGVSVFSGTAYYNNPDNWEGGALFIGKHLIDVKEDVTRLDLAGVGAVAEGALGGCYSLKYLTIGGDHTYILSSLTNLETLVITELPTVSTYVNGKWCYGAIASYFGSYNPAIPLTLSKVVIKDGADIVSADHFYGITGITIYVEAAYEDVQYWDDLYPNWHNGNRVVYGGDWITVDFYDFDGNLISGDIYTTSQVVRIPYLAMAGDSEFDYELLGWDLDGDGIADTVPATSSVNLSAYAVFAQNKKEYTVNFYDKDGETVLYSERLPYGTVVKLPDVPTKKGYIFVSWSGYTEGMVVTGDIAIYSVWSHNGGGHEYGEPVWVAPTCTDRGYYKHSCTICDEYYGSDYVAATGHNHVMSVVAPGCLTEGYDLYLCTCGDSYKENFVDAVGHSMGEWVIDLAPTCLDEGSAHRLCGECSHREVQVIPAVGHTYVDEEIKVSTCEDHGVMLYTCEDCGDKVTEETALSKHRYEKKVVAKWWLQILIEKLLNIFFGFEGNNAFYFECVECGHIQTSEEAARAHSATASTSCTHASAEWTVAMEPSCFTDGVEWKVCTLCEKALEARVYAESYNTHDLIHHAEQDATCTADGWKAYEACSRCDYTTFEAIPATGHTEVIVPGYDATYTKTGLTDGKACSECGEILVEQVEIPVKTLDPNFKIASAYLNLTKDINMMWRTKVPAEYENAYMVFTFNGKDYEIREYTVDEQGRLCFLFPGVMPHQLGDNIKATLYATVDGELVSVVKDNYSIKDYAAYILSSYPVGSETATLMSDIMVYGEKLQLYRGYKTDDLVTEGLTLSQSGFTALDDTKNKLSLVGTADSDAKWKGAGLYLENAMSVRFGFTATNVEDLTVEISINGRTTVYQVSELEKEADGQYRIYFRGISATEFDDEITAIFKRNGEQVGRTVTYSVNSYIHYMQNSTSGTALVELIKAIYCYGAAAEAYSN